MDVDFEVSNGLLSVHFSPDDDDKARSGVQAIHRSKCGVRLVQEQSIEDLHPDHLALVAILLSHPFIAGRLNININVSPSFRNAIRHISRYKIHFPDGSDVIPYAAPADARPGLSYSGGMDSAAALLLMPKETVAVFLDRPSKPFDTRLSLPGRSLYNNSAALANLKQIEGLGWEVHAVNSDLEFLRSPLGFPTDMATAVPLIVNASALRLDSVAYGTIMESAYRVGHARSRNYMTSGHHKLWAPLFEAAGLPLNLPVAGLSEVMTSTIVDQSPLSKTARSCIRGIFPKVCNNCWKCFRKQLVDRRLREEVVDDRFLLPWLKVREVKLKMKQRPIPHENVLSWALQGPHVTGRIAETMLGRLEGSVRSMDLFEQWLSHSEQALHPDYSKQIKSAISRHCETMNKAAEQSLIGHSMQPWLESEAFELGYTAFDLLITEGA